VCEANETLRDSLPGSKARPLRTRVYYIYIYLTREIVRRRRQQELPARSWEHDGKGVLRMLQCCGSCDVDSSCSTSLGVLSVVCCSSNGSFQSSIASELAADPCAPSGAMFQSILTTCGIDIDRHFQGWGGCRCCRTIGLS
jgi:hypothetical protein